MLRFSSQSMKCEGSNITRSNTIQGVVANKRRHIYPAGMDEGRERVLVIVAGILVARHLKAADDLYDCKPSQRTESLVAAAVQWAERIMKKIDNVFSG